MNKIVVEMKVVIICASISLLAGCVVNSTYDAVLKADQFSTEIKKLEAVISKNAKSSESRLAHYQLARLYTSYKNPKRNYKKSLENLELYLDLHPNATRNHELQDWLSVLTEIQNQSPKIKSQNKKIRRLTSQLKEAREANLALTEANNEMEKHNTELTTKIDILKTLDQNVEEKRKSFKSQ